MFEKNNMLVYNKERRKRKETHCMQKIANEIRGLTLKCVASLGSGHIGGSLSIVDLLTVLYYKHMNVDPKNPKMEARDRLVCSKGHAGPAVYAVLAHKGYFPVEELETLNKFGTNLPSHCDMNKTPGVDMTTGSLGQGISCAVGLALGSKIVNDGAHTVSSYLRFLCTYCSPSIDSVDSRSCKTVVFTI